jgi:hypothetical protein
VNRGDHVEVTEPGIRPWSGIVKALKPTPRHGLFVEIERDDTNHECYSIAESNVSEVPMQTALGWGA